MRKENGRSAARAISIAIRLPANTLRVVDILMRQAAEIQRELKKLYKNSNTQSAKTKLFYNKQTFLMRIVSFLFSVAALAFMSSCNSVDFKKTKGGLPYKLFP